DRCVERFGFDPGTDGPITAAALLGQRDGEWEFAWNRFAEAPRRYPNLPDLLRRARTAKASGLFEYRSSWPQENEEAEESLRKGLLSLRDAPPAEARRAIAELEVRTGNGGDGC